jgi:hypothetical protein
MRKRPPQVDPRTRAFCAELVRVSADQPLPYRLLGQIARTSRLEDCEAKAAVIDAVRLGWLIVEGEPPHIIALTEHGRRMVANWLRGRLRRAKTAGG